MKMGIGDDTQRGRRDDEKKPTGDESRERERKYERTRERERKTPPRWEEPTENKMLELRCVPTPLVLGPWLLILGPRSSAHGSRSTVRRGGSCMGPQANEAPPARTHRGEGLGRGSIQVRARARVRVRTPKPKLKPKPKSTSAGPHHPLQSFSSSRVSASARPSVRY